MINTLPQDLLTHLILRRLTIFELGFVARVCKLWCRVQSEVPLHSYKTSILLHYPEIEGCMCDSLLKQACIKRLLFSHLQGLRLLSGRFYLGQNSIVLPYCGRLYLMTLDPLFIPSQSHMHGLVRTNNDIQFYCASPKTITRRRIFKQFQLVLGLYKMEAAPPTNIHDQLKSIGAFPIATEAIHSWNNVSLTYYLLVLTTPFLFLTKGQDLIAIYSTSKSEMPISYNQSGKADVYEYENEIWRLETIDRSIRIMITLKTS